MGSIDSIPKPTVVLVPGAFHTPECWNVVISQLKEYGYPTNAISLPSAGGELSVTVEDDAAHIRKTTAALVAEGKEVIIVMHSYGGIPGTESAQGLLKKDREAEQKTGGIISLVYITAFLLPPGVSMESFMGGKFPDWAIFNGDKVTATTPGEIFYNDLPDSLKEELIPKVLHQAKPSFCTPLTYPAYNEVPSFYLLCDNDNAIPFAGQEAMAQIGGSNTVSKVISSGHSVMLSKPDAVVDLIRDAAAAR